MNSILQTGKECYICHKKFSLEIHHIFFGTANRKLSEKDGLKVWLCYEHHRGTYGVHGKYGINLNYFLKKEAEQYYLSKYNKTKEDFIKRYGENYL